MKKITIIKFKPIAVRDRQIKSAPLKCELPWYHNVPVLHRLYTK